MPLLDFIFLFFFSDGVTLEQKKPSKYVFLVLEQSPALSATVHTIGL